jgi:hypothetical protein
MTGMKNGMPGRVRRRAKPAAHSRLTAVALALKAMARVVRELTRLIWWSAALLATVGLAAHALLTGSAAELIDLLVSLRPG